MSTESSGPTETITDLTYEQARDELVAIVAKIEGGSASLEESMTLWERGEALAAHCQAKLDQAQEQLDRTGTPGPGADTAAQLAADDEGTAGDEDTEGTAGDEDTEGTTADD